MPPGRDGFVMNPVTDENPPTLKVPRRGSLRADATGQICQGKREDWGVCDPHACVALFQGNI